MLFPLLAAATLSLAGEWTLSGEGPDGRAVACGIRVPGDVHAALCATGVVPDTFVETNELAATWVNRRGWTLSRTFAVDENPWNEGKYVLSIVNDTDRDMTDDLIMERWDFDGKASNYWVSAPYKDCPLAPAKINVEVQGDAETESLTFSVRLTTDYPAFFVWANAKGIRGEFDDNSILLLPNAPRTLTFTAREKMSLAAFKRALTVRHLQESVVGSSAGTDEDPGRKELRERGL